MISMRTRNRKNKDKNENENENKKHFLMMYKDENSLNEYGDDQRNLEARYLIEMRDYDTKMIQFDYDRRAQRRRRQALLDKERSLQKREKILGSIHQNTENDPQFLQQDQNYIISLKRQLDVLHAEIDYQHSLLLSISKKVLSRKKANQRSYYSGENTNYYFLSLKQQERDLLEKKELIDSRQIEAKRILAEPIDDIRLEELLINDIEEDAELVANQFNSFGKINDDENINQILIQLEELESRNRTRKKDLVSRKSVVKQEINMYSNRKPEFTKKSPNIQRQADQTFSYSIKKEKVSQIINNICNSLAQRQKNLADEEQQIDEIDAQNKKKRISVEKSWNKKVEKIKSYTLKIREIEKLKLKISDMNEKIQNEKQAYIATCEKKKKIKRKISVIIRDKNENSKKNAEYQDILASLNKRRMQLDIIDQKIKQRSYRIKEQEKEIKHKEEQNSLFEEKISNLELEVSKLQKLNDEKIQQIQENTAQFEASRLAYLSKIEKENAFSTDINMN